MELIREKLENTLVENNIDLMIPYRDGVDEVYHNLFISMRSAWDLQYFIIFFTRDSLWN
jgi:hypothetical protein